MKNLVILPLVICFLSCKHSYSQGKPKPEAIELNNKAFFIVNDSLFVHPDDSTHLLKEAMIMINKAIQIDSNYYAAYRNKLDFQSRFNRDSAFATAKHMIKKWPKEIGITLLAGEYCESKGDTALAAAYYKKALLVVTHITDSIGVKNPRYEYRQIEKAKALILLNQPATAHVILKDLFDKSTNKTNKQRLKDFMEMDRHDVLYGKTTIIKHGSSTTTW